MSEITQPAANAFKAKSIARGKLLERFRCHVQEVVEHAEDEGDRVYFGTSNHFEYLKEIADEMDMWGWDAVIRERDEVDPYADLRKVRDENRSLIEERDRLREAIKPAYLGLLVLKTMCRKAGLVGGVEATDSAMAALVSVMPELPAISALRPLSPPTAEGREP